MASIYETLLSQLGPEAVTAIGDKLGVDQATVQQGIQAGLPLLINALAQNTQTPNGAQSLAGALSRDHDGSALNNPVATINSQSGDGAAILQHVFGNQTNQTAQGLSQQTGLDGGQLLQMLAPLVLAQLGSVQRQQNLDPNGVAATLHQEQQNLLGSGLLGILGQLFGGTNTTSQTPPTLASAVGGGPISQLILAAIGPELVRRLATLLNVDQNTAQQALAIAIPLLLAALARNTQRAQGADALHQAVSNDHDGSLLNNPNSVLANAQRSDGEKIIKHVLGNQAPTVAQTISEQTGVDGQKLLASIAPLVLGALGQQTRDQGLDSQGLAGALQEEQQNLQQSNGSLMQTVTQVLTSGDGSGIGALLGSLFGK